MSAASIESLKKFSDMTPVPENWIIWKHIKRKKNKQKVISFHTSEGMWYILEDLLSKSWLDYIYMKSDITPFYEDAAHSNNGGIIKIKFDTDKEDLDNIMLSFLLSMIGGSLLKDQDSMKELTGIYFVSTQKTKQIRIFTKNRDMLFSKDMFDDELLEVLNNFSSSDFFQISKIDFSSTMKVLHS